MLSFVLVFLQCTLERIELSLRRFVLPPFARAMGLGGTEPLELSCSFYDSLSQVGRRTAENRTLMCYGCRVTFKASTPLHCSKITFKDFKKSHLTSKITFCQKLVKFQKTNQKNQQVSLRFSTFTSLSALKKESRSVTTF